MAVENHPVHPSTMKDSNKLRHCTNRTDFKPFLYVQNGWTGDGRKVMKSMPFTMSNECRYDKSLTDAECTGCSRRGEGEAYGRSVVDKAHV